MDDDTNTRYRARESYPPDNRATHLYAPARIDGTYTSLCGQWAIDQDKTVLARDARISITCMNCARVRSVRERDTE